MNLVLYHGSCTDGFTSALLLHLYFKEINQEAEFIPVEYNRPMPFIEDQDVYIVDFSYEPKLIHKACETARSITILDHHLTAAEMYGGYIEVMEHHHNCPLTIKINEEASGATMVYKYLLDKEHAHGPLPFLHNPRIKKLVYAVEDYDLWKFTRPDTHVINELLQLIPKRLEHWEHTFLHETDEIFQERFEKAIAYFEVKEAMAQEYASKSQIVRVGDYEIPVVNCPANFANRVCEILNNEYPFALSFVVSPTELYCSLRSRKGFGIDVSSVAKKFGGGGHFNSSGFKLHPNNVTKLLSGRLTPKPKLTERILDQVILFVELLRYRLCK